MSVRRRRGERRGHRGRVLLLLLLLRQSHLRPQSATLRNGVRAVRESDRLASDEDEAKVDA